MNLVLLFSIILVTQLPLNTFGKSSLRYVEANPEAPFYKLGRHEAMSIKAENNDNEWRRTKKSNSMFNNAADDDNNDILINKLSREYATSSNLLDSTSSVSNNFNEGLKSDLVIENSLRGLFNFRCLEDCRLHVFSTINEMLKCVDQQNFIQRDHRSKWNMLSSNDDLFVPVQGKRSDRAPSRITPKRKDAIELNDRDYFVLNRGKRQQNHIVDEVSKSGMKVIIPKSHTPLERDPWLFRNINLDDRNMIDLLGDLNQPGIEANKDIKAKATAKTMTTTTTREKFIPRWNNEKVLDKTAMIFNPLNDEFNETLKTPDGVATNLIFTNTPHHDETSNRFTSRFN